MGKLALWSGIAGAGAGIAQASEMRGQQEHQRKLFDMDTARQQRLAELANTHALQRIEAEGEQQRLTEDAAAKSDFGNRLALLYAQAGVDADSQQRVHQNAIDMFNKQTEAGRDLADEDFKREFILMLVEENIDVRAAELLYEHQLAEQRLVNASYLDIEKVRQEGLDRRQDKSLEAEADAREDEQQDRKDAAQYNFEKQIELLRERSKLNQADMRYEAILGSGNSSDRAAALTLNPGYQLLDPKVETRTLSIPPTGVEGVDAIFAEDEEREFDVHVYPGLGNVAFSTSTVTADKDYPGFGVSEGNEIKVLVDFDKVKDILYGEGNLNEYISTQVKDILGFTGEGNYSDLLAAYRSGIQSRSNDSDKLRFINEVIRENGGVIPLDLFMMFANELGTNIDAGTDTN